MSKPEVEERAKALEDEFFRRQDEAALAKLRSARERDQKIEALQAAAGVGDPEVLGALIEAGVDASTYPALTLVPLAAVAWASGTVEPAEREAVLRAAREAGVADGSPAHGFLIGLLEHPLDAALMQAWEHYTAALSKTVSATARRALGRGIAKWARAVAEAAGGFLGLSTVSIAEGEVLERIARAFDLEDAAH